MAASQDPFAVLGIRPTLERGLIKRAYFGLLPRHPPHADPEGFRRLRAAYEALCGERLLESWAKATIDVAAELASIDEQLGERIEAAKQARARSVAQKQAISTFEGLLRLDLAGARARVES